MRLYAPQVEEKQERGEAKIDAVLELGSAPGVLREPLKDWADR